MSKDQEIDIINGFSSIQDMNLGEALEKVEKLGFKLRVLYVNSGDKKGGYVYDAKFIGVRIHDPEYDYSEEKPSVNAIIDKIVDVGGVDEENRGLC